MNLRNKSNNNSQGLNSNYLNSQTSINKNKSIDSAGLNLSKNEIKINNLNKQINLLREYKKSTLESFKQKFSPKKFEAKPKHIKTKLIPKERFIKNDTEANFELELLDYKVFEKPNKPERGYNSDILNLLTKNKNLRQEFKTKINKRNLSRDEFKYSKNASVPRTTKDFLTYTDKLNSSSITIGSKNSEKSYNNILFTDGGITNINIHRLMTCDDIPNEVFFNDKRNKYIQYSLSKALQDNFKKDKAIKEFKSTMDILKCYIKIQEVNYYYPRICC
jgi:hypothetical protein